MRTLFITLLSIALLVGCDLQKKLVSPTVKMDSKNKPLPIEASEIVGQIAEVIQEEVKIHPSLPSHNSPYKAQVKVLKVLNKGEAFSPALNSNDVVNVGFAYTLAPSDSVFSDSKRKLPGLKAGDTFRAHVRIVGKDKRGKHVLEISDYDKL